MPQINGYSIYVAPAHTSPNTWTARVYRDSNDERIGLVENGMSLEHVLDVVRQAIEEDQ